MQECQERKGKAPNEAKCWFHVALPARNEGPMCVLAECLANTEGVKGATCRGSFRGVGGGKCKYQNCAAMASEDAR